MNALSQHLTVEIKREGKIYRQDYRQGIPQSELRTIGMTKDTGTSITFKPNTELFGNGSIVRERLEHKIEEMKLSDPGLTLRVYC